MVQVLKCVQQYTGNFVVFGDKYTCDNSNPLVFQTPMVRIPRFSGSDQK